MGSRWEGAVLLFVKRSIRCDECHHGADFTFGNPVSVPRSFIERGPVFERDIDVTRDGKFLGVVPAGQGGASGTVAAPQIQVVLNWFDELKARVPTK